MALWAGKLSMMTMSPDWSRHQHLFDIGQEHDAVHCAVIDKGCDLPCQPKRAGKGCGLLMTMRHGRPASVAAWCSASQPGHFRRQSRLVDEDELGGIEIELAVKPGLPPLQDVGAVLLQCVCGLFLYVQPRPRSQALKALRLILTDRST